MPSNPMRLIISLIAIVFLVVGYRADEGPTGSVDECTVVSWNIQTFGKSKTDAEVAAMAEILKDSDIAVIQEVIAGHGGAQAVARLDAALDRTGAEWDYRISHPTLKWDGCGSERYAYLWKKSRAKLKGQPFLVSDYEDVVCREPYVATFTVLEKDITFLNIHAIPMKANQHPSQELKYLREMVPEGAINWVIAGDFNCSTRESVWNPLRKRGFEFILQDQRTTLKQELYKGYYLANPKDNILFHPHGLRLKSAGIFDTYVITGSLEGARELSDHVPVWAKFTRQP